jgi:sporulation protein YlmC with PRC-barrel domain
MSAVFAAVLAAAMPVYAQTAMSANVTSTQLRPDQIRMTQMNGATVYDTQNRNIGDIKDIILDRDGRVGAVILDVGAFLGMGGKYVAVSLSDLKITRENNSSRPHFTVDMTKEQLKAAQAYDLGRTPSGNSGTSTAPNSPRQ